MRRLAPSLRDADIAVEFETQGHGARIIRIYRADNAPGSSENVVAFATPSPANDPAVREVADALRAVGLDAHRPPSEAAALALQKAVGDASLAAEALNLLGIHSPGGGSWTSDALRGVV